MGAGFSTSTSTSVQNATSSLTQQYNGTCDIECNNDISDIDITLIRSRFGNITLDQVCSANATCLMNSSLSATSDVLFKAQNSSAATDPMIFSWADPGVQVDVSRNHSVQNIQQVINQAVDQTCKVTSTNQINNVNIFAEDSFGGNIDIAQEGQVGGECQLQNNMTAAAYATGTAENCASAGKIGGKKCAAGKGGKTLLHFVVGGVVLIVVIILLVVLFRFFSRRKRGEAKPSEIGTPSQGESAPQTVSAQTVSSAPTAPAVAVQPGEVIQIQIVPAATAKPAMTPAKVASTP